MYTHKDFHLTCDMLLHYLVKVENPFLGHSVQKLLLFSQRPDQYLISCAEHRASSNSGAETEGRFAAE